MGSVQTKLSFAILGAMNFSVHGVKGEVGQAWKMGQGFLNQKIWTKLSQFSSCHVL